VVHPHGHTARPARSVVVTGVRGAALPGRGPRLPRVSAHALRHTAASLAIHAGANPLVVQRMLGHSSAAMTLDVYADLFESDLDAVAENVGKMWARAGGSN
jgi:integrase